MQDAIEGFILAGGKSRRMGTDKSQLVLNGQSFVERIAGKLLAVTSSIKVVGGDAPQAELKRQINLPLTIQAAPEIGRAHV